MGWKLDRNLACFQPYISSYWRAHEKNFKFGIFKKQPNKELIKTREAVTPVISHKLYAFLMFRLKCMYPYLDHDIQVGSGVGREAPQILCSQTSGFHKELEEAFYSSAQPDNPEKQQLKELQAKFRVTL